MLTLVWCASTEKLLFSFVRYACKFDEQELINFQHTFYADQTEHDNYSVVCGLD